MGPVLRTSPLKAGRFLRWDAEEAEVWGPGPLAPPAWRYRWGAASRAPRQPLGTEQMAARSNRPGPPPRGLRELQAGARPR